MEPATSQPRLSGIVGVLSCLRADLEKVLIHWNAVASAGHGEVAVDISFHVLLGGGLIDVQEIKHKFSDGVGGGEVRCRNVSGVKRRHYIVAFAMFRTDLIRNSSNLDAP